MGIIGIQETEIDLSFLFIHFVTRRERQNFLIGIESNFNQFFFKIVLLLIKIISQKTIFFFYTKKSPISINHLPYGW
jgi:hypothetical protein